MIIRTIISTILLIVCINIHAQKEEEPFRYIDRNSATEMDIDTIKDDFLREEGLRPYFKTYKQLIDDKSEFNKGEEPFKTFIKKFMTDKNFREERIVLSEEQVEVYKSTDHSYLFNINMKNASNGIPLAGWTEMSADEVNFINGWVLGEAIDLSTFNRSGGLWYLTDYIISSYDEEEGEVF